MRIISIIATIFLTVLASSTLVAAQGAEIRVLEPMQEAEIRGNAITVIVEVEGRMIVPSNVPLEAAGKQPEANRPDEGHLHLMLDLQPVVVWDKTEPYIFQNVPPGEHQLTVEIVNNDHSSLTPPVVIQRKIEMIAPDGAPINTSSPEVSHLPHTGSRSQLSGLDGRSLLIWSAAWFIVGGFLLRRRYNRARIPFR